MKHVLKTLNALITIIKWNAVHFIVNLLNMDVCLHGCQMKQISIQTKVVKFLASSKNHQNCEAKLFMWNIIRPYQRTFSCACQNPVFCNKK